MTRIRSALLLLALTLAACSSEDTVDIAAPTSVPTSTATVPARTSTATSLPTSTSVPSSTATQAPTATSTALPTSSSTSTPEPTSTSTSTPEPTSTPTSTSPPAGAVALFHADALDPGNPFPSDRLLDDSGHVVVTGGLIGADLPPDAKYDGARALANLVAGQLKQLTGFSTYAPMRVKFDRAVTAPANGGAFVVNCDSGATPVRLEATTLDSSGDFALEIYPVRPLLPKTTYVYVVTRDVLDGDGQPISPAAELTRALNGEIASLAAWRGKLDCALGRLAQSEGVTLADVAAIDVFTTQPTTDGLLAVKDLFADGKLQPASPAFENSPIVGLPTGIFPEGTSQFADLVGSPTSDSIAAVAIGSFPSYDFRKRFSSFDPEFLAGNETPPVNQLDFYMAIPKAPPPAGGYPIVIFGHGLGGSGQDAIDVAKLFGDAPLVTIGISALQHGRRGTVSQFFNLTDGFATRENFRQSVADMLQLALMVRNATVPPFDQVNKDRVHYMGISLGGIMGTLFMGNDPNVRVGMLSVPGGGLPNIIQSTAIGALLKPLISLTTGISQGDPQFPAFLHRFFHLSQWVVDAGDPINTGPVILDPDRALPGVPVKRILMQEGVVDDVVPNPTTDALALAMGLPDANATFGCDSSAGCSGIWRYDMVAYGFDANSGHGVTGLVPQAAAQAAQFLLSDGTVITNASLSSP